VFYVDEFLCLHLWVCMHMHWNIARNQLSLSLSLPLSLSLSLYLSLARSLSLSLSPSLTPSVSLSLFLSLSLSLSPTALVLHNFHEPFASAVVLLPDVPHVTHRSLYG